MGDGLSFVFHWVVFAEKIWTILVIYMLAYLPREAWQATWRPAPWCPCWWAPWQGWGLEWGLTGPVPTQTMSMWGFWSVSWLPPGRFRLHEFEYILLYCEISLGSARPLWRPAKSFPRPLSLVSALSWSANTGQGFSDLRMKPKSNKIRPTMW